MLLLMQTDTIYARALLKDKYLIDEKAGDDNLVVEGLLKDSYHGADGKLLYLVFYRIYKVCKPDGAETARLGGLSAVEPADPRIRDAVSDQLFIEGDRISMVRYFRRQLPMASIEAAKLDADND
jgi:hypothetical protein